MGNKAVVGDSGFRGHEGGVKDQPIFLVVVNNKALRFEHEVGKEIC